MKLRGGTALVTGASRGIGAEIAVRLAYEGMNVAIVAREKAGLEETAGRIYCASQDALVIPADITDSVDREMIVQRIKDELGPIDLLVNNAGVEAITPFVDMNPTWIESIVETNLLAPQLLSLLVLPEMLERGHGHIVNVASIAAKAPSPFSVTYAGTKAGLVGFSWSLREELHGTGVGVSVLCPCVVEDTGLYKTWETDSKPPLIGFISSARVASRVVRTVKRNRAEAIVAPRFGRAAAILAATSPDFVAWIGRRVGVSNYMRRLANARNSGATARPQTVATDNT